MKLAEWILKQNFIVLSSTLTIIIVSLIDLMVYRTYNSLEYFGPITILSIALILPTVMVGIFLYMAFILDRDKK